MERRSLTMPRLSYCSIVLGTVAFIGVGTIIRTNARRIPSYPVGTKEIELLRHLKERELTVPLRYAVFGGANAWGAGLSHRFDAYPYLLSSSIENYAQTSTGPNFVSVCTETVVGDDVMFDVVVLDYWLRYFEGLEELSRRLRERFPHAIIVLVRAWLPVHFKRKSCEVCNDMQSLKDWKDANGLTGKDLATQLKAIHDDTGYWYLPEHTQADAAIWNIKEAVKGYQFSFSQRATGKETLEAFYGYYDETSNSHLNQLGHSAIADGIKSIVGAAIADGQEIDLVNSGVHGHWGSGDNCRMWYLSGGTDMEYSESLSMVQFDKHNGFFALEVNGLGWFIVENKLDDSVVPSRTLYLSYLTSENANDFPDAEVSFGGQSWRLSTLNTVDPHHDMRTISLGQVPYGSTNVTITPIGTGKNPFRLVGLSFTNQISTPLEYGFGPSH